MPDGPDLSIVRLFVEGGLPAVGAASRRSTAPRSTAPPGHRGSTSDWRQPSLSAPKMGTQPVSRCHTMTYRLRPVVNGEGGIRTRGTGVTQYDGLANRCFQPLSHLSGRMTSAGVRGRAARTCHFVSFCCRGDSTAHIGPVNAPAWQRWLYAGARSRMRANQVALNLGHGPPCDPSVGVSVSIGCPTREARPRQSTRHRRPIQVGGNAAPAQRLRFWGPHVGCRSNEGVVWGPRGTGSGPAALRRGGGCAIACRGRGMTCRGVRRGCGSGLAAAGAEPGKDVAHVRATASG